MKCYLDFEDGKPATQCKPEDAAVLADIWRLANLDARQALERLIEWERERLRQRHETMHDG